MRIAPLLFCAATVFAGAAGAQWAEWDRDVEENTKPWKEIEAKIPSYPKEGGLLAFDAGPTSPHRFFLDAQSLSIGEDGVVRYTLVVRTSGGATNVTFEGIRCQTRELKVYAIGQRDGGWTRARDPKWRRIQYQELNRHHNALYGDYLCAGGQTERYPYSGVAEILQRVKSNAGALSVVP